MSVINFEDYEEAKAYDALFSSVARAKALSDSVNAASEVDPLDISSVSIPADPQQAAQFGYATAINTIVATLKTLS